MHLEIFDGIRRVSLKNSPNNENLGIELFTNLQLNMDLNLLLFYHQMGDKLIMMSILTPLKTQFCHDLLQSQLVNIINFFGFLSLKKRVTFYDM